MDVALVRASLLKRTPNTTGLQLLEWTVATIPLRGRAHLQGDDSPPDRMERGVPLNERKAGTPPVRFHLGGSTNVEPYMGVLVFLPFCGFGRTRGSPGNQRGTRNPRSTKRTQSQRTMEKVLMTRLWE